MPDHSDDWETTAISSIAELEGQESPRQAALVVVRGINVGESFPIMASTFVIGRGTGSDLRVSDEGVSRFHCKLSSEGNAMVVEDLNSRNGTFCNGERITTRRRLNDNDRLQVGTTSVFRFTYVETTNRMPRSMEDDFEDPVTGMLGRRRFMEELGTQVGQSDGTRQLSLVLVHLDRSDEIAGPDVQAFEKVMTSIATQLRAFARPNDVIARLRPADLVLLARRASPGDTFMLAERLRKQVYADSSGTRTLSIGIASMHEITIESAHDFMVGAGAALHRARVQGGNRTVLCTPDLMRDPKNRVKV